MNQLYTAGEIIDDITRFEGPVVGLPQFAMNSRFVKLYSEHHSLQLPRTDTVVKLKERIKRFILNPNIVLINPDVVPQLTSECLLYGYIPNDDLDEAKSVFLAQFDRDDDLEEILNGKEIIIYPVLLYVNLVEQVITQAVRNPLN